MAKHMRMSQEVKEELLAKIKTEFDKKFAEVEAKLSSGKMPFEKNLTVSVGIPDAAKPFEAKATLYFTDKAWTKILALVHSYSIEVEWYGLVRRETENSFCCYDILAYPHENTATTVTADQAESDKWFSELTEEQQEARRLHGHSHVNMSVTPSVTDTTFRENVRKEFLPPCEGHDDFFIFIIVNKKLEVSGEIFDQTYNIDYDTPDISFVVRREQGSMLSEWDKILKEAKELVKEPPKPTYGGYYGGGYSGYGGGYSSYGGYKSGTYLGSENFQKANSYLGAPKDKKKKEEVHTKFEEDEEGWEDYAGYDDYPDDDDRMEEFMRKYYGYED